MRACIRLSREIFAQAAMLPYAGKELAPGAAAQSDDALDAFISAKVESAYHPCGTCRMGTDGLALVDPDCRVIGVQDLRVIDASTMPQATAGDLNGPTIMLAERGADILRKKCLPAATTAPLMVSKDWQTDQRMPTVTEDYASRRSDLRAIFLADLTM